MNGVALWIAHPEIPSCADCRRWIYDPRRGWEQARRAGKPQARPAGSPLPCGSCPKSADKRTPNPAAELSPRNQRAYELYLTIQAGAPMPDDAIVRRNCALLHMVERQCERNQSDPGAVVAALLPLVMPKPKGEVTYGR